MTAIRSITVAGIRGIRKACTLELDGRSVLIRGDNGTGKSSFVQAMSLALTGSPTGPGTALLPQDCVRHRLEANDDAKRVVIDLLGGGKIELTGDALSCDEAGRAFRDACVRAAPFLRRDELLRVVNAEGTSRLRYLEAFLELGPVEQLERRVSERTKELAASTRWAEAEMTRRLGAATRALGEAQPLTTTDDLVHLVVARARTLGLALPETDDWTQTCAAIAEAARRATVAPNRRELLVLSVEEAKALAPPEHPKSALASLRKAEQQLTEAPLSQLLEDALELVDAERDLSKCPVCEQAVTRRALTKRLRERIADLSELREHQERVEELGEAWREFLRALDDLEETAFGPPDSEPEHPEGRELLELLESKGHALSPGILSRLKRVRTKLGDDLRACANEQQSEAVRRLAEALDAFGHDLAPHRALEADLKRNTALVRKLKTVSKAVGDARKMLVARTLSDISSLVTNFYERIHPAEAGDEPTGAPSTVVQRYGSGVAHLRGTFDGVEIDDPRHVYSDGHLDTVGLCIYLALRRSRADREGVRDPNLMVLDDVVMSIDMGHAARLLELLRDEFEDHQLLVVSHNALFMKHARATLTKAKAMNIAGWSLHGGPRVKPHKPQLAELREKLEDCGDPPTLAAALGPVLDPFVHEASEHFGVRLPYGREDLTIAEFWGPLRKRLREVTGTGLVPDLEPLFTAIGEPEFFRNTFGAHYNAWAMAAVALRPIQQVAQGLVELIEQLSCTGCNAVVRLKNARKPADGLACQCPKGAAPTLRCQSPAT